jgi:S-adenosylmethionine:tRNA ribosyltransferase-isomerase
MGWPIVSGAWSTPGAAVVTPAAWPRDEPLDERLLLVDPRAGQWRDARIRDLPAWLSSGDLMVVNDAATLPASFVATGPQGRRFELRLAGELGGGRWRAVLFGEGDFRTRTENRPPPATLERRDKLQIAPDFEATVEEVDPCSSRLLVVCFSRFGAALWSELYRHGRPVQYAHVAHPLEVWQAQTPFASRPWAVEMPSAGRPLSWALVAELRRRGVHVAALTHAAGLSSTGDHAIDESLPFPERFDLPAETVRAVAAARSERQRVVAVGTTVVRALEGCASLHGGELIAGAATTDLRIGEAFCLRVVDGILTGLHEVGSSHRELLLAFAPEPLLGRALAHADAQGYLGHEFGDACLVLGHLKKR